MRGKIQNRDRAKQLRDFTGLRFGSITPTDVDGFVEFRDKLFVWIEAKLAGAPVEQGQRMALERVCDAVSETERMAVVLVVDHNTDPTEDIDFASCSVREWRYLGEWREPVRPITCRAAIDTLLDKAHILL